MPPRFPGFPVLVPHPLPAQGVARLDASSEADRLWQALDRDARLRETAHDIRANASTGAREIDPSLLEALGQQGVLVDTAALIAALTQEKIQTAALDVLKNEPEVPEVFPEMPQLALTPHVGSASVATSEAMADLVVSSLASWASGNGAAMPVP